MSALVAGLLGAAAGIVFCLPFIVFLAARNDDLRADLDRAQRERDGHRYRAARYREMRRHARAELLATRQQLRAEHVRAEGYLTELDAITEATRYWPANTAPRLGVFPLNSPHHRSN